MSEPHKWTLEEIQILLAEYQPIDPVVLDMLPPETSDLHGHAAEIIEQLHAAVKPLMNQLSEMKASLDLYSQQAGDPMFLRNLELCLRQVRAKKG